MSISIPISYQATDINSQGGIMFGIPIQSTGLRTLANNHNFMGANYAPVFGYYQAGAGIGTAATTSSTWANIVGTSVPAQADARQITVRFQAKNAHPTDSIKVRVKSGIYLSSETTIPAGSDYTTYTATVTRLSTAAEVCTIQAQQDGITAVRLRSAIWSWSPLSSVPTGLSNTGWRWAVPGDHVDTEPLTVEQYNRFRGGPRVMFEGLPQTASSMVQSWYTPDNINKTSRELMGWLPVVKRRNTLKIRFDVIAQADTVEIFVPSTDSNSAGTYHSVTPSVSSSTSVITEDPSNLSFNSTGDIDFSAHPIFTMCAIYATSPDTLTQSRVYSAQGVVVV